MPYIDARARPYFEPDDVNVPGTAGQLNYQITRIIQNYVKERGVGYDTYRGIIGDLVCITLEYYRRIIGPYEDLKCRENGDVY